MGAGTGDWPSEGLLPLPGSGCSRSGSQSPKHSTLPAKCTAHILPPCCFSHVLGLCSEGVACGPGWQNRFPSLACTRGQRRQETEFFHPHLVYWLSLLILLRESGLYTEGAVNGGEKEGRFWASLNKMFISAPF